LKEIHIDCSGMTEDERTVAMLTAILENIELPKRKALAKEIRERNRREERRRKSKRKWHF